jgi:peptidoglycan-associated lipoprotein
MKKVLITLILAFVAGFATYAQKNFAEEADTRFNQHKYYEAIPLYRKAYSKVKGNRVERARLLYQMALCYRLVNDNRGAEVTFRRVIAAKYPDPLIYLYYADALKSNEKYEEASVQYAEYKRLAPDDPRADIGLESCSLAVKWRDEPTRYELENNRKMNSRANDFAPSYADRKYRSIVFTTSRDGVKGRGEDAWTGQSFTDLFIIELDRRGNWGNPVPLDETGELNSTHNEGAATFNDRFNTIYFTRCEVARKQSSGCQIYTATKRGRGWGNIELSPLVETPLQWDTLLSQVMN